MKAKKSGRRRFLKDAAVVAGLAAGGIRSASGHDIGNGVPYVESFLAEGRMVGYGQRSRFEASVRAKSVPQALNPGYWMNPLQDQIGIITPSGLAFVNPSSGIPDIDPEHHRLMIHGLVDRPLIFTVEELKRLPSVSRIYFLECAGNSARSAWRDNKTVQDTHGRVYCSEWIGVPLSLLLKEAGVQKGARWLICEGGDAPMETSDVPMEKAMDDVLVAYGQNGEALRPENGYPLRLVVPGWGGDIQRKWLRRIQVTDQTERPSTSSTEWRSPREKPVKSVITFPSLGQWLSGPGFYEIRGFAWSAGGVIRRVEVSTDGGRTWKDAQLQEPVLPKAFTRFCFPWNWDGEDAVIQSRATDERGDKQPTLLELSKIRGVSLDFWLTNRVTNPIHPWRVTREGVVLNALV